MLHEHVMNDGLHRPAFFLPSAAAAQNSAGWSFPLPEQSEVSEQTIPILHVEKVARTMTWHQRWDFNRSGSIDLNRDFQRLCWSRGGAQGRLAPSTAGLRTQGHLSICLLGM